MSVMDVLGDSLSPREIMELDLPFVMDLVKAKIRLEESKSKAQRAAQELEKLSKR